MRRLSSTTAVVILLASALCWGQRGVGFRGGDGFHGGGGFAPRGGMGAGGFRGGAGQFAGRGAFHGGSSSGFHSGNGFHHPGHGPRIIIQHGHFNNRFRAGFYSPYPYYYSPFWGDWADSSYDSQADNSYAQYQSNAEINRLSDEVQELREEQRDRQYESSSMRPPAPQPKTDAKQQEDLPVVLVFLDKRIQEVKNYAVANEKLIVLEGNRRRKYPLADIDLAATMKLNDERGVNFEVPNPVMTQ